MKPRPIHTSPPLLGLSVLAAAVALGSVAQAQDAVASDALVQQRVRAELRAVMTGLIQSGTFGDAAPGRIHLEVEAPAQRVSDLGLLVDSSRADADGLHVLAVTPGGSAERMGIRAGDVLAAVDNTPLGGEGGAGILRAHVDALPDGAALAFSLRRDGSTQRIGGTLSSVYLPPMRLTVGDGTQLASRGDDGMAEASGGCGRISDFDVAPRQQQLHAATIISIDGKLPGPSGSHAYRVAAGTHEVKVAERIDDRYLSFNDRARNAGVSSNRYKTLVVDVAPDTTTLVAARLNEAERNNPANGAYWDPVAWKQTAEPCR